MSDNNTIGLSIRIAIKTNCQYKYLHACVSSYAKEVRDKLKPDEDDIYVPTAYHNRGFDASDDEYVIS